MNIIDKFTEVVDSKKGIMVMTTLMFAILLVAAICLPVSKQIINVVLALMVFINYGVFIAMIEKANW